MSRAGWRNSRRRHSSGGELREGYAEIGDVRLHYVEAGEGPLVVLLHGFPEFWYGWRLQIEPLAAGFRVVAPDMRGYNLSSRPKGVKAYDTDQLTADIRGLIQERGAQSALLVGHDWGGSVAWATAMAYPEAVDRLAILNAAHPRKLSQGLHHPGQLRKSWYFFFFDLPELPEAVGARQPLAFLPALSARRPPGLYPRGEESRSLHRGVVAARRRNRDDQLLPVLGADLAEEGRSGFARSRRPPWSSGGSAISTSAPNSPNPTMTTYPTSTASSACPTPRTGHITTRPSALTNCSSTSSPPPYQPRTTEMPAKVTVGLNTESAEGPKEEFCPRPSSHSPTPDQGRTAARYSNPHDPSRPSPSLLSASRVYALVTWRIHLIVIETSACLMIRMAIRG